MQKEVITVTFNFRRSNIDNQFSHGRGVTTLCDLQFTDRRTSDAHNN